MADKKQSLDVISTNRGAPVSTNQQSVSTNNQPEPTNRKQASNSQPLEPTDQKPLFRRNQPQPIDHKPPSSNVKPKPTRYSNQPVSNNPPLEPTTHKLSSSNQKPKPTNAQQSTSGNPKHKPSNPQPQNVIQKQPSTSTMESKLGVTTLNVRSKRYAFPSVIVKTDADKEGVCVMLDVGLFCPFCAKSYKSKITHKRSRVSFGSSHRHGNRIESGSIKLNPDQSLMDMDRNTATGSSQQPLSPNKSSRLLAKPNLSALEKFSEFRSDKERSETNTETNLIAQQSNNGLDTDIQRRSTSGQIVSDDVKLSVKTRQSSVQCSYNENKNDIRDRSLIEKDRDLSEMETMDINANAFSHGFTTSHTLDLSTQSTKVTQLQSFRSNSVRTAENKWEKEQMFGFTNGDKAIPAEKGDPLRSEHNRFVVNESVNRAKVDLEGSPVHTQMENDTLCQTTNTPNVNICELSDKERQCLKIREQSDNSNGSRDQTQIGIQSTVNTVVDTSVNTSECVQISNKHEVHETNTQLRSASVIKDHNLNTLSSITRDNTDSVHTQIEQSENTKTVTKTNTHTGTSLDLGIEKVTDPCDLRSTQGHHQANTGTEVDLLKVTDTIETRLTNDLNQNEPRSINDLNQNPTALNQNEPRSTNELNQNPITTQPTLNTSFDISSGDESLRDVDEDTLREIEQKLIENLARMEEEERMYEMQNNRNAAVEQSQLSRTGNSVEQSQFADASGVTFMELPKTYEIVKTENATTAETEIKMESDKGSRIPSARDIYEQAMAILDDSVHPDGLSQTNRVEANSETNNALTTKTSDEANTKTNDPSNNTANGKMSDNVSDNMSNNTHIFPPTQSRMRRQRSESPELMMEQILDELKSETEPMDPGDATMRRVFSVRREEINGRRRVEWNGGDSDYEVVSGEDKRTSSLEIDHTSEKPHEELKSSMIPFEPKTDISLEESQTHLMDTIDNSQANTKVTPSNNEDNTHIATDELENEYLKTAEKHASSDDPVSSASKSFDVTQLSMGADSVFAQSLSRSAHKFVALRGMRPKEADEIFETAFEDALDSIEDTNDWTSDYETEVVQTVMQKSKYIQSCNSGNYREYIEQLNAQELRAKRSRESSMEHLPPDSRSQSVVSSEGSYAIYGSRDSRSTSRERDGPMRGDENCISEIIEDTQQMTDNINQEGDIKENNGDTTTKPKHVFSETMNIEHNLTEETVKDTILFHTPTDVCAPLSPTIYPANVALAKTQKLTLLSSQDALDNQDGDETKTGSHDIEPHDDSFRDVFVTKDDIYNPLINMFAKEQYLIRSGSGSTPPIFERKSSMDELSESSTLSSIDEFVPEIEQMNAPPEVMQKAYEAAIEVAKMFHHHSMIHPCFHKIMEESGGGVSNNGSNDETDHVSGDANHSDRHKFETMDVNEEKTKEFLTQMFGAGHKDHKEKRSELHSAIKDMCASSKENSQDGEVVSEEVTTQEVTLVFAWPKGKKGRAIKEGKSPFREMNLRRIMRSGDVEVQVIEGPSLKSIESKSSESKSIEPKSIEPKSVESKSTGLNSPSASREQLSSVPGKAESINSDAISTADPSELSSKETTSQSKDISNTALVRPHDSEAPEIDKLSIPKIDNLSIPRGIVADIDVRVTTTRFEPSPDQKQVIAIRKTDAEINTVNKITSDILQSLSKTDVIAKIEDSALNRSEPLSIQARDPVLSIGYVPDGENGVENMSVGRQSTVKVHRSDNNENVTATKNEDESCNENTVTETEVPKTKYGLDSCNDNNVQQSETSLTTETITTLKYDDKRDGSLTAADKIENIDGGPTSDETDKNGVNNTKQYEEGPTLSETDKNEIDNTNKPAASTIISLDVRNTGVVSDRSQVKDVKAVKTSALENQEEVKAQKDRQKPTEKPVQEQKLETENQFTACIQDAHVKLEGNKSCSDLMSNQNILHKQTDNNQEVIEGNHEQKDNVGLINDINTRILTDNDRIAEEKQDVTIDTCFEIKGEVPKTSEIISAHIANEEIVRSESNIVHTEQSKVDVESRSTIDAHSFETNQVASETHRKTDNEAPIPKSPEASTNELAQVQPEQGQTRSSKPEIPAKPVLFKSRPELGLSTKTECQHAKAINLSESVKWQETTEDPKRQVVPKTTPDTRSEIVSSSKTETALSSNPETASSLKAEIELCSKPKTASRSKPETESSSKAEIELCSKPETESSSKPETASSLKRDTESRSKPEINSISKPEMDLSAFVDTSDPMSQWAMDILETTDTVLTGGQSTNDITPPIDSSKPNPHLLLSSTSTSPKNPARFHPHNLRTTSDQCDFPSAGDNTSDFPMHNQAHQAMHSDNTFNDSPNLSPHYNAPKHDRKRLSDTDLSVKLQEINDDLDKMFPSNKMYSSLQELGVRQKARSKRLTLSETLLLNAETQVRRATSEDEISDLIQNCASMMELSIRSSIDSKLSDSDIVSDDLNTQGNTDASRGGKPTPKRGNVGISPGKPLDTIHEGLANQKPTFQHHVTIDTKPINEPIKSPKTPPATKPKPVLKPMNISPGRDNNAPEIKSPPATKPKPKLEPLKVNVETSRNATQNIHISSLFQNKGSSSKQIGHTLTGDKPTVPRKPPKIQMCNVTRSQQSKVTSPKPETVTTSKPDKPLLSPKPKLSQTSPKLTPETRATASIPAEPIPDKAKPGKSSVDTILDFNYAQSANKQSVALENRTLATSDQGNKSTTVQQEEDEDIVALIDSLERKYATGSTPGDRSEIQPQAQLTLNSNAMRELLQNKSGLSYEPENDGLKVSSEQMSERIYTQVVKTEIAELGLGIKGTEDNLKSAESASIESQQQDNSAPEALQKTLQINAKKYFNVQPGSTNNETSLTHNISTSAMTREQPLKLPEPVLDDKTHSQVQTVIESAKSSLLKTSRNFAPRHHVDTEHISSLPEMTSDVNNDAILKGCSIPDINGNSRLKSAEDIRTIKQDEQTTKLDQVFKLSGISSSAPKINSKEVFQSALWEKTQSDPAFDKVKKEHVQRQEVARSDTSATLVPRSMGSSELFYPSDATLVAGGDEDGYSESTQYLQSTYGTENWKSTQEEVDKDRSSTPKVQESITDTSISGSNNTEIVRDDVLSERSESMSTLDELVQINYNVIASEEIELKRDLSPTASEGRPHRPGHSCDDTEISILAQSTDLSASTKDYLQTLCDSVVSQSIDIASEVLHTTKSHTPEPELKTSNVSSQNTQSMTIYDTLDTANDTTTTEIKIQHSYSSSLNDSGHYDSRLDSTLDSDNISSTGSSPFDEATLAYYKHKGLPPPYYKQASSDSEAYTTDSEVDISEYKTFVTDDLIQTDLDGVEVAQFNRTPSLADSSECYSVGQYGITPQTDTASEADTDDLFIQIPGTTFAGATFTNSNYNANTIKLLKEETDKLTNQLLASLDDNTPMLDTPVETAKRVKKKSTDNIYLKKESKSISQDAVQPEPLKPVTDQSFTAVSPRKAPNVLPIPHANTWSDVTNVVKPSPLSILGSPAKSPSFSPTSTSAFSIRDDDYAKRSRLLLKKQAHDSSSSVENDQSSPKVSVSDSCGSQTKQSIVSTSKQGWQLRRSSSLDMPKVQSVPKEYTGAVSKTNHEYTPDSTVKDATMVLNTQRAVVFNSRTSDQTTFSTNTKPQQDNIVVGDTEKGKVLPASILVRRHSTGSINSSVVVIDTKLRSKPPAVPRKPPRTSKYKETSL